MYIGEMVSQSGASHKAIRLYESLGLLGPVQRRGAYRFYSSEQLAKVQLIRQAQVLGFRLAELKDALQPRGSVDDWQRLLAQLAAKRISLRSEIERLQALELQISSVEQEIRNCVGSFIDVAASEDCSTPLAEFAQAR